MSLRQSAERIRTHFAWQRVERWETAKELKKIGTRLQGLPVEVRAQGLSTALATLLRENRRESIALADCLVDWLRKDDNPYRLLATTTTRGEGSNPGIQLLSELTRVERSTYLAIQTDALGLCEALKLLASALLEAAKGGQNDAGGPSRQQPTGVGHAG